MRSFVLFSALAVIACAVPAVRQSCTAAGDKCAGAPNFPLVPYSGCCDRTLVCGPRLQPAAGTWGAFCITAAEAAASTPAPPSSPSAAPASVAPTASAGTTAAPAATTTAAAGSATTVAATDAPATTVASSSAAAPLPTTAPAPVEAANTTTTAAPTAATPNATEANVTTPIPTVEPTAVPNDTITPNRTVPTPEAASNGSKCFPMTATVELKSGEVLTMDKLSVGDVVKVGRNSYSKVFMFTHKMATGHHSFVQLNTASGASISLTAGHYIPVDGSLTAASEVAVGDLVQLGNGVMDQVTNIKNVAGTGLYNPQTLQGDIVIDGIVASTYTTAVEPRFAHAILSPFRAISAALGVNFAFLESGGGVFADVTPGGSFVC